MIEDLFYFTNLPSNKNSFQICVEGPGLGVFSSCQILFYYWTFWVMIQIYFQYSKWSEQNFNSVKLLHLQFYLSVSLMLCEQFKTAEKTWKITMIWSIFSSLNKL